VRIYFNLSPEGAVAVMSAITRQLNEIAITFNFKALYNPSNYKRYDSAVLYFDKSDYEAVRQVLQVVYRENPSHFRIEMSEVAQAISEAKEGEVIGPIETKIGYHIIKIEKWFPAQLSESVREEILESLFQAWLREQSSSH
jgi:hypothetical protein